MQSYTVCLFVCGLTPGPIVTYTHTCTHDSYNLFNLSYNTCRFQFCQCFNMRNRSETANAALRDALHRFYQGVLYFQNVLQFYGTGARCNLICFHKKSNCLCVLVFTELTDDGVMCKSQFQNFTQIGLKFGSLYISSYIYIYIYIHSPK
jgi:hypothetical protein